MSDQEPPPLYHGTRRGFTKRGLLMPRTFHQSKQVTTAPLMPGKQPREDSEQYVYVTTSKILAWAYAWAATGRGRPRVLTVAPLGPVWPDPEHSVDMEAYRCEAAVVVDVDFEPMITETEANAGWQVGA